MLTLIGVLAGFAFGSSWTRAYKRAKRLGTIPVQEAYPILASGFLLWVWVLLLVKGY